MTDKLPPLLTPIAPPSQSPVSLPPNATAAVHDVPRKQETVEEEPYTIKCICNFTDDDGNTIFCETCETWQHIECYYPDNIEDALSADFAHSCAECQPRILDRQQAIARQRARTAAPVIPEAADKKPKRPPSKSHKKKPKPTELQINGNHHNATEVTKHTASHDQPHPPKKAKNSHKPSQSISAPAPKRSPSYGTTKVGHGHPPSPATTPPDPLVDFEIHNYSSNFLSLYNDQAVKIVRANRFTDLQVSSTMSNWLRDPEKMKKDTSFSYDEVFQQLPPDIDSRKIALDIESTKKEAPSGAILQWQCLRAPAAIGKDVPLMELNGCIGFQATYCADPENRWAEFTSPLPFVLFHPFLPLYIDTRKEGSEARFVRRSCQPNADLQTYLSDGSEYHFWLVSDRQIAAKEQITIPWDFRFPNTTKTRMLRALGLSDDLVGAQAEPTLDEAEYQTLSSWLYLVLSEYGGCACNLGSDCAFARFHKTHMGKIQIRPSAPKSKKRKPKTQQAISPTSTGHATNSRAPSEGHADDAPDHERRSVSGSSRSKPPSRDLTPTARQGSFDTLGILTEPTDRDKRKVAMVEDSFRKLEQQQQHHQQHQHQQQRKRKRASDGSSNTTATATATATSHSKGSKNSSAAATPNLPNGFTDRQYVDVGTSVRSKSGSPTAASAHRRHARPKTPGSRMGSAPAPSRSIPAAPHASYCDRGMQTDGDDRSLSTEPKPAATPKNRVSSLSKRLFGSRHRLHAEREQSLKQQALSREASSAMEVDSPTEQKLPLSSPASLKETDKDASVGAAVSGTQDTPMVDAPAVSPTTLAPLAPSPLKHKSPDLRVQMPPVPAFGSPTSAVPSSASTPLSAGASMVQSPFSTTSFPSPFAPPSVNGVAATPSPAKKRISLSDYKSRQNKAAAARPLLGTPMLKPAGNTEDPKSATSIGDGGSPTMEKTAATESATMSVTTPAAGTKATPLQNGSV